MALMESVSAFFNWMASFGYIGLFVLSVLSSATIIFPTVFEIVLFVSATMLNPFLLGIICGLGTTLGEFVGYYIGLGGKKALPEKYEKKIEQAREYFHKYGGFLILTLFAATPLPDDVVGIFAGLIHYPKKKFFIAVLIGKIILCMAIAYAGYFSAGWFLNFFGISL